MQHESYPAGQSKRNSGRSLARIGLLITAGLVILAAVLLLLDPFRWHLIDRIRGQYDAALTVMPADSRFYIGVNLLSSNVTRLDELADTFTAATDGSDLDVDSFQKELEETLAAELNISFGEDILPWLGQYVGFALIDVQTDEFGQPASADWVLATETRDRDASDQFIEKLALGVTNATGETPSEETYQGAALTAFSQLAAGRSGRLVLLASGSEAFKQAVDTQSSSSLGDTAGYRDALKYLDNGRIITAYVNSSQIGDFLSSSRLGLLGSATGMLPSQAIQGTTIGISVADPGIQIDAVTVYQPDMLTPTQKAAMEVMLENPETAALLPADTLLYAAGTGIDLFWQNWRQAMIAELGRSDFEESMRLLEREFGMNPDTALLPFLAGEAALALIPADSGTLADSGIGLGAAALLHAADPQTVAANVADFSERIGRPLGGLGSVTQSQAVPGLTAYEFTTPLAPDLRLAYGTAGEYLLIGSDTALLETIWGGNSSSLADSSSLGQAWSAFPDDMSPGLFVDVRGLMALLQESQVELSGTAELLSPVPYVAAAGSVHDTIVQNRILVFIEPDR